MPGIESIRIPLRVPSMPLSGEKQKETAAQSWVFEIDGQRFDFKEGKILLNGQDLARVFGLTPSQASTDFWAQLSKRLSRYREWAAVNIHEPDALGKFSALVHAYLAKIFGKIKRKFDETIDGVSFALIDGELFLNGINVHAVLERAQTDRNCSSEKSRILLKGLRQRLALLQTNRMGNANYEKIRDTVESLSEALEKELRQHLPRVIALPPPAQHLPLDSESQTP